MTQGNTFNAGLLAFLAQSPTPFHATTGLAALLDSAGFEALPETADWALRPGGRYYTVRNGSSIVAFVLGADARQRAGIRMLGAHTDSPCLMVRPRPESTRQGYFQLGVEVYGGVLLNPWFDRDLSLAGRVVVRTAEDGLRVTVGAWIDKDEARNEREITAAVRRAGGESVSFKMPSMR